MTDANKNPPAGDPPAAGGDGGSGDGTGTAGDPPKPTPKPDTVSYETHRRLLDEKKKAQAELDTLKASNAERERKEAEAKGDFQRLLEQERAKSAELDTKLKERDEQEKGRRKLAAILDSAGGIIDRKWFGTISAAGIIDAVIIDPDTGSIDTSSVTKAVEQLKQKFPEIIVPKGGPRTPNANPAAGGGTVGTIRYSEYLKLNSREMAKWKPDQIVDD